MKNVSILALFLGLASCATNGVENSARANEATSVICSSCGSIHHYAATFDDLDYALIAGFCDEFQLKRQVFWRAPHGPTPGCSSTYASDLSWDYLRENMPRLRRDTFESFQKRNRPIPTHEGLSALADRHGIAVIHDQSDAWQLTRGGFSASRQQALIYSGRGFIHLFERRDGTWRQVDSAVLWIS